MNTIPNTSDIDLKWEILNALKMERGVNVSEIGVIVKNGVVTLIGSVTCYGEKWNTLRAAQRINDSRVIIDDIIVSIPESCRKTDSEISKAAKDQIIWSTKINPDAIHIEVKDGWLTASGELDWWYLKNSVSNILNNLEGVYGITNLLTIKKYSVPVELDLMLDKSYQNEDEKNNSKYAYPGTHPAMS